MKERESKKSLRTRHTTIKRKDQEELRQGSKSTTPHLRKNQKCPEENNKFVLANKSGQYEGDTGPGID